MTDGCSDAGRSWAAGALLALKHFNTRDSSLISAFGQLSSCDVQLVAHTQVYNTRGNTRTSVQRFITSYTNWKAVVGPSRSATSLDVARIGGVVDVPQMGYWATSPSLNSVDYPMFGRTIPDDTALNTARMAYFDSVSWKRMGLLYVNEYSTIELVAYLMRCDVAVHGVVPQLLT